MTARSEYESAAELIYARTTHRPTIGLVLGSGMGEFAATIQDAQVIETHEIPGWPRSTVEGHKGQVIIGLLEGKPILALQGRVHFYEGYTPQQVVFPVRVMHAVGIKTLFVTNAAGGLNRNYAVGDLMVIQDHINFVGLAGHSPLIGPNDSAIGPRFPDMTTAYDGALRTLAHQVAQAAGLVLHEGVYCCVAGPSYETPAEIRMLRTVGGDAVGMSTAPEVVAARHAGMRVFGVSGISNICHDTTDTRSENTHAEVMAVGQTRLVPALTTLLRGLIQQMD